MKKEKSKKRQAVKTLQHPVRQPKKMVKESRFAGFLGLAIITILGIVIYSNSFTCSFHFDDVPNIVDNKAIQNLSDLGTIWNFGQNRFIAYLSLALNYHFDELNVWGYHFVNLCIHLINAYLVYWLTLLIFSCPAVCDNPVAKHKRSIAFFTALLFVSHPLATQSVTYIVQRMASLVSLFYMLSLAMYIQGRLSRSHRSSKYLWYAGSLASALLALLSKENAYTLPIAIVLVEIFFLQKKKLTLDFKDPRILGLIATVLILAIIIPMKFSMSIFKPVAPSFGNPFTITSLDYFYTQFSVMVKYIQLLVLPIHQNLDYDFPLSTSFFEWRTLLSFLLILLLIGLAVFLFKKNRIISFGIFWFFLTLSIESTIIPLPDLIFEHRTYLPSFGFFLILSYIVYKLLWDKYKTPALAILSVIVISNAVLTYQRNKVWEDELTLMDDAATKSPGKARPFGSRGDCYRDLKQYDKAIADYSTAIRINPNYSTALHNRGGIYSTLKQLDKALADYSSAIRANPLYTKAYYNRGVTLGQLGKWDSAVIDYNKAIETNPDFTDAYYNRGIAYNYLGMYEKAIPEFTRMIEFNSQYADAYYNRALAYNNLGQTDKAINDYSKSIEINPNLEVSYYNRGILYGNLKQWDKSIADYTHAIGINPRYTEAYINRGVAYFNLGQYEKAIADYSKAIEIDPKFTNAVSNREIATRELNKRKK